MNITNPVIKQLDQEPYIDTWQKMRDFTINRTPDTADELWILEHPPVFTQGQAGKPEHLLSLDHAIPIIQTDRGGQITYHGPGQIVVYLLINLRNINFTIRKLVTTIEQAIINTLKYANINSYSDKCAPGVYTDINNIRHKICSIGLRVKKGCTYHGLALNYDMDLTPFSYINPCGFNQLQITQISALNNSITKQEIINTLCEQLCLLFKE